MRPEWKDRIAHWMRVLEQEFYEPLGEIALEGFETMDMLSPEEAEKCGYKPMPAGTVWGPRWGYLWLRGEIVIPQNAAGRLAGRITSAFNLSSSFSSQTTVIPNLEATSFTFSQPSLPNARPSIVRYLLEVIFIKPMHILYLFFTNVYRFLHDYRNIFSVQVYCMLSDRFCP